MNELIQIGSGGPLSQTQIFAVTLMVGLATVGMLFWATVLALALSGPSRRK